MGTWGLFLIPVCLYRCLKCSRVKKILHFLLISQPSEGCKLGINSWEFLLARLELDSLQLPFTFPPTLAEARQSLSPHCQGSPQLIICGWDQVPAASCTLLKKKKKIQPTQMATPSQALGLLQTCHDWQMWRESTQMLFRKPLVAGVRSQICRQWNS